MQYNQSETSQSDTRPVCAVCHKPIDLGNYWNQKLNPDHVIALTIAATAKDAFLPWSLEVHGECLKELRDQLVEKNRGCTWR